MSLRELRQASEEIQMKLRATLIVGVLTIAFTAHASEPVGLPDVRVGDKWVVQGKDALVRVNESKSWKVRREVTQVDGNIATWRYERLPPASPGTGQSRFDLASQVMQRELVSGKQEAARFPLAMGNEWSYEYQVKTSLGVVKNEMTAKVVAWEDVTVPAGTFRALRIEHKGKWSRATDFSREGFSRTISAPVEVIYWYAPAVKAIVKSRRTETSYYGGTWAESEEELVEFSPGG